jgi:uncharacterized protein YbbC (DUF1343 family)
MLHTGAEVAAQQGFASLRGKRVGVVCNPASLVRDPRRPGVRHHLVDVLKQAGVDVRRLFGPEHGLWSTAQDLIAVDGGFDAVFGQEVRTLYGRSVDSLKPAPESLDGLDVLVFDVPDVGARYYTYAATLCMALDVCAQVGVSVVVFDRPNPLGGEVVEGNAVGERFRSFVGWLDVPQRHGLTLAELARLHVAESGLQVDLQVVPVADWDVAKYLDEQDFGHLGTTWYAPSPNMPTVATAVIYPGTCLVEGTRLSEGRGSTRPFELVGAAWLDARDYADRINQLAVPGLHARPMLFEPTFQKYAGQVCGGAALEVHDRRALPSVRAGLAVCLAAWQLGPAQFAWRTETYEFVSDRLAFDLLMGGTAAREALEAGHGLDAMTADFAAGERAFAARAKPVLLYPRRAGWLA